jgi:hypothetical protein
MDRTVQRNYASSYATALLLLRACQCWEKTITNAGQRDLPLGFRGTLRIVR